MMEKHFRFTQALSDRALWLWRMFLTFYLILAGMTLLFLAYCWMVCSLKISGDSLCWLWLASLGGGAEWELFRREAVRRKRQRETIHA